MTSRWPASPAQLRAFIRWVNLSHYLRVALLPWAEIRHLHIVICEHASVIASQVRTCVRQRGEIHQLAEQVRIMSQDTERLREENSICVADLHAQDEAFAEHDAIQESEMRTLRNQLSDARGTAEMYRQQAQGARLRMNFYRRKADRLARGK